MGHHVTDSEAACTMHRGTYRSMEELDTLIRFLSSNPKKLYPKNKKKLQPETHRWCAV